MQNDTPWSNDELYAQKEWFRVTLSSIGDAVIATDAEGQITFMNPIAQELTGWTEAEARGMPLEQVFQIINEKTRQPVENPVTRALRENTVVGLANNTLLIRKDGRQISIADSAAPIRSASGETIGVVLVFRDFTEQRRAEIAIQDAKEYAENIVDTVRHPLLVLDGELRVQTANRSFYKIFRATPEATEGQLVYELGHGQWDIPDLRRLLTEILPQNTSFDDFDVQHDFPDIGHRYMRLNARRMYREGNHTNLILLAIEDLTEQKQAEAERQESETRFTSLVKNIKDHAIFTLDPSGYITTWNREAENILGFSEQEAIDRHFSIIFTPEDVEQGVPQQEMVLAKEAGRAEDERWHQRKNGERFWALGIVTPTTDAEDNHTGYSKILRDITERKLSQEALVRQSELLRMLWDSAAVLLTASDPKVMLQEMFNQISKHFDVDAYFHFVVDQSGEFLRLVSCAGIPEADAQSIERLDFGQAVCGTVAQLKESMIATYIQQSDDPKTELVKGYGIRAYACNPLIYQGHLIGTLSFASRRQDKFEEEELAFFETLCQYVTFAYVRLQLVQELQEAHQRKDEFLAMLAHELRNPLTPIRSGLDLLTMENTPHQDTIKLMQAQMNHVVRLVDDLMDVSRIVQGKVELRKKPVELGAVIRRCVDAIQPHINRQQQEFVVSIPEQELWLNADPMRLVQILENLLNNASKYTDAGGQIELQASHQQNQVVIQVRDTGIGVEPEMLPKMFELFTQAFRSLDRAQGGLGIGLTLVKRLVEMHDGTVSAYSKGLGHGSTFTVQFPLIEATTPANKEEEMEPHVTQTRRILVVDDNIGAAKMLSMLLTALDDHEIETVHDGPSALQKIKATRPEIVFLDIGLPGMDGYQVATELRKDPNLNNILLVALTGYGQEKDRQMSKDVGFDAHLVKPPSLTQIKDILAHTKLPE